MLPCIHGLPINSAKAVHADTTLKSDACPCHGNKLFLVQGTCLLETGSTQLCILKANSQYLTGQTFAN